jgi:hypothetical protein
MPEWMRALVEEVSAWPGVSTRDHRFGGVEFRVCEREIGHVHDFGIVDIPFPVGIRDLLVGSGLAERHHWLPQSGWTTVKVKNQAARRTANRGARQGTGNALRLLRLSYLRVQLKSPDALSVSLAREELRDAGFEKYLPDAHCSSSVTGTHDRE